MNPGEKFVEFPIRSTKLSMRAEVKEWIRHEVTTFQTIDIVDTYIFGRVLFLDGHVQLSEFDEHAYHESLVHIPLLSMGQPLRALVVGGGDGGVLRELAKHDSLQAIDMVEIDEAVINACRSDLPSLSGGAFDDPRVKLHIADAFEFVRNVREPYDLIIMDVTDTYEDEEGEISEKLFTDAFHIDCRNALKEKGLLVSQADNQVFCPYSLDGVLDTFSNHFDKTGWYQALIPSFGGYSAFAWASNKGGVNFTHVLKVIDSISCRYLSEATLAIAECPPRFS